MKYILASTGLIASFLAPAQNLLPNPSFEEFDECPKSALDVKNEKLNGWFHTHSISSPDFYNECGEPGAFGSPMNCMGYIEPSSGNGYAGLWAYIPNIRGYEFIACALNRPMERGKVYEIEFQVALGDESAYYLDHLTCAFTSFRPYQPKAILFEGVNTINLEGDSELNTKNKWKTIRAEYTANGTERFLMFGFIDFALRKDAVHKTGYKPKLKENVWKGAYYFFDDASVKEKKIEEIVEDSLVLEENEMKQVFNEGKTFVLDRVYFDIDKYELKEESFTQLDSVVMYLNEFPDVNLEVLGHTDSTATEEHNVVLSQNRADAVKEYLVAKGIDATRLSAKGYASSIPRDSNETEEGRARNRRVEFKVIKKESP